MFLRDAWLSGIVESQNSRPERMAFELADDTETKRRSREIKVLVNILEPNPDLQPYFLSDEAGIGEVCSGDAKTIQLRLESYFGRDHKLSLELPLWKLVDQIKQQYPGWPDNWPPLMH